MTTNSLGWMATAMLAASYLCRQPAALRKMQAAAACLWIIYGMTIGAMPVVVANLIVAVAALLASYRGKSVWTEQWSARVNRPVRAKWHGPSARGTMTVVFIVAALDALRSGAFR